MRFIFLIIIIFEPIFAKRQSDGIWHQVKAKQTLWRIARTYNIPLSKIKETNRIKNISKIKAGDWIFIPGVDIPKEVSVYENKDVKDVSYNFLWPIKGKILNKFRDKKNERYNGIDIAADYGNYVNSAGDGIVKYIGNMRGYGNVVIIKHNEIFATVYGCLDKIYVKELQNIKAGKILGTIGKIHPNTQTFLHFEIIKNGYPIDPLKFLM